MLLTIQTYASQGYFWIAFGFMSAAVITLAVWLRQPD